MLLLQIGAQARLKASDFARTDAAAVQNSRITQYIYKNYWLVEPNSLIFHFSWSAHPAIRYAGTALP